MDTGLFRQLGELLVGRDSTALVELIKNAYDADATTILLRGEHLEDPDRAVLTVADDGTGMTEDQFRRGFLRLAARSKTSGERRSPVYQRRYTGEKGVGRLAAHKLAAVLDVVTVAAVDRTGSELAASIRSEAPEIPVAEMLHRLRTEDRSLLLAQLDWDLIEAVETLSDVNAGLTLEADDVEPGSATGTTLNLSRLRHAWTTNDLRDLIRQLHNFEPPGAVTARLPRSVLAEPLLFEEPTVRKADRNDPGLKLELEGDFRDPEEFWGSVQAKAEWVMEIRAARGMPVTFSLAPTRVGRDANSFGQPTTATTPHPTPEVGPFFDARILLRPGHVPAIETGWTELNSGIRIYLEGFRVLPYGEPRNDWLSLDSDYTKRTGRYQIDPLLAGPSDSLSALRSLAARDVSLRLLANRAFFGAVFLTESGLGGLRTLVNREGFVPDEAYDRLVGIVGIGMRLLQRARALASLSLARYAAEQLTEQRRREAAALGLGQGVEEKDPSGSRGDSEDDPIAGSDAPDDGDEGVDLGGDARDEPNGDDTMGDSEIDEESDDKAWTVLGGDSAVRGSAARLFAALEELRMALDLPVRAEQRTVAATPLTHALASVEEAADLLAEDSSLLRVLASIGAQLSAFTHEVAQLVPAAVAAERALAPISGRRWPPEAVEARRTVAEIRRSLERQASYLVDVASTEGRRRRSRQNIAAAVNVAFLGFQGSATARQVELVNGVDGDFRTPPVFRAELQAVLTNLLSNAIKTAGSPGRVEVSGADVPDGIRLVVQNTGVAVEPGEAEQWFVPYASTTANVDPVLGQGMGLGLPITRDLVSEYGGTVRFVHPATGFATAVEVVLPE